MRAPPGWAEDPDLAAAVADAERFVASSGWDRPPQLFALVRAPGPGASAFTLVAQDWHPADSLDVELARLAWPPEVDGVVLVQEIVVPPTDEGRLAAGVLRGKSGGACLLRIRGRTELPVRGGALAPNVVAVLARTFLD